MTWTPGVVLLVFAISVVLVLACFFIFCRKYEEGIFGNLVLCGIAGSCAVLLWDALVERDLQIPDPAYCLLIVCFAGFKARHAWRFAMFHWHGWFGWTPPSDMAGRKMVTGTTTIPLRDTIQQKTITE